MSTPEKRKPVNSALRESISRLETVGHDYAGLMLMDTPVNVDMIGVAGEFTPPKVAFEAFRRLKTRPPLKVTNMSLDLTYDRMAERFRIRRGEIGFDNSYGLAFLEPECVPHEDEMHHPMRLFRQNVRGKANSRGAGLKPTSFVHDFFRECGVDIPLSPHRADWESVMPMLAAAQTKAVTAIARKPLDRDHLLLVAEQTIQTAQPQTGRRSRRKPNWMQELSLQVVDYGGLSVRALEAVLRTNTRGQEPKFERLYEHSDARLLTPPGSAMHSAIPRVEQTETESVELRPGPLLTPHIQMITTAIQTATDLRY